MAPFGASGEKRIRSIVASDLVPVTRILAKATIRPSFLNTPIGCDIDVIGLESAEREALLLGIMVL